MEDEDGDTDEKGASARDGKDEEDEEDDEDTAAAAGGGGGAMTSFCPLLFRLEGALPLVPAGLDASDADEELPPRDPVPPPPPPPPPPLRCSAVGPEGSGYAPFPTPPLAPAMRAAVADDAAATAAETASDTAANPRTEVSHDPSLVCRSTTRYR